MILTTFHITRSRATSAAFVHIFLINSLPVAAWLLLSHSSALRPACCCCHGTASSVLQSNVLQRDSSAAGNEVTQKEVQHSQHACQDTQENQCKVVCVCCTYLYLTKYFKFCSVTKGISLPRWLHSPLAKSSNSLAIPTIFCLTGYRIRH